MNFALLKLGFEVAQSTVAKTWSNDRERLCRTVDRINPARVCGSYRGLGRGAFASDLASLCPLLQRHQNAPVTGQRRTGPSPHSADRRHRVIPDPRLTSSPLRPGVKFSVHTRAQIGRSANLRFRRQALVGHAIMVRTLAIDYGLQERRPSSAIP
jgi:hypothetical protein